MRQIVLDTETTGLEPSQGHRVIEIGCVELENRRLTGRTYHRYINPQREVDEEAVQVHGITNEFLADKPLFGDIIAEFQAFIRGAELVIHNAAFDVGFLNHEFALAGAQYGTIADLCSVVDTLALARRKHPGQKNNLDALCKRYAIDNSQRELHGALLDSEILADVYLMMTGGQTALMLGAQGSAGGGVATPVQRVEPGRYQLAVAAASDEELAAHRKLLALVSKKSGGAIWSEFD